QEKAVPPLGKKLSAYCSAVSSSASSRMAGTADASVLQQMIQALEIGLDRAVHRDAQGGAVEAHGPVHVAREIAKLERRRGVARDEGEPRLLLQPHDDGAIALQQQDGTVRQAVAARQQDGAVGAAVGRGVQAPARRVFACEVDVFHLAVMLEVMQALRE